MGYDLNKIGMARPAFQHCQYARNIVINYYNEKGFEEYEALNDGLADLDDTNGLVPDVVFYEVDNDYKAAVAIEIEKNKDIQDALDKAKRLYRKYRISEIFVLDYNTLNFYKFVNGVFVEQSRVGYSDILDFSLHEYLHLYP